MIMSIIIIIPTSPMIVLEPNVIRIDAQRNVENSILHPNTLTQCV